MTDKDFSERVTALDVLILAYKPHSSGLFSCDYNTYWNRNVSPSLSEIHTHFSELLGRTDFNREWLVGCFMATIDHRLHQDRLFHYPSGENGFIRLGKFIQEQLLCKQDIENLSETHQNHPFKRDVKTALAALYMKLEKAAIEEENDLLQPIDEQNKSKLTAAQWVEQLAEEISEAELNGFGGNKTRYFESLSNKHNIGLSGSTLEKAWNSRNKK